METENAAAAAAAAFTASSQLKEAVLGRCLPVAGGTVFPKRTGFQARAEPGSSGGQAAGPSGGSLAVSAPSAVREALLRTIVSVSGSSL